MIKEIWTIVFSQPNKRKNINCRYTDVVRNAWEARFILLRYMCEEKEEKTCPSWMLAVHGSQKTKEM